jgi:transposase
MQAPLPAQPSPEALLGRITELEALVARLEAIIAEQAAEIERLRAGRGSGKTPQNSSVPPSAVTPPNRPAASEGKPRGARRGHRGSSRRRCQPDRVIERWPECCTGCGRDLTGVTGHVKGRSQQVELVLQAVVVEVRRFACRCPACGTKNVGTYPKGWDPRQRFSPRLQALLAYLHHHQHMSYARLAQLLRDLCGLRISAGGLANTLSRVADRLKPAYAALREQVRGSPVVGSDETRARVSGKNQYHWVAQSPAAAYHWVGESRATRELETFYDKVYPEVQGCDCYSGQLASKVSRKQICMAHQLRDLLHAVEHGDTAYAPKMLRLIGMAIRLWHRRDELPEGRYRHQANRLQRLGHRLGWGAVSPNPFGEAQQRRYQRLEGFWWVFLERDDVEPTNNASERALRTVVVHRKVNGGFRTRSGAEAYAQFVSVVQTAQKQGREAFAVLMELLLPHGDPVALTSPQFG